jgi:hypothetical protein
VKAAPVCFVFLVSLAGWPGRGAWGAQPTTSDIERLIKRGTELRTQGQAQTALPLFQKAYDLATTPRTSAQLGLCEMQLGYWLAAEEHLAEALAGRSDWLEKYRSVLDDSLRRVRKQIGEVTIVGSPSNARVLINGRVAADHLPAGPVRVSAGKVIVEVGAPNYVDEMRTVTITGDNHERVTINLRPQDAGTATKLGPADQSIPSAAAGLSSSPRTQNQAASGWSTRKIAGITMLGMGVVASAGGATLLAFDKHQSCSRPLAQDQCETRLQTRVPGWSILGVGAATAIVGSILFFGASNGTAVSFGPSSVKLAGRF